jgi:DNA-binding transcriptional regulator YdaS (Cro superfamily)
MKLSDYLVDRNSQTELAKAIGAQPQLVWQWKRGVRHVPVARCVAIERATAGKVSRRDLRPVDWVEYWPELADVSANAGPIAMNSVAALPQGV